MYLLCLRGFDSTKKERFYSRLRILRLLVCGPEIENAIIDKSAVSLNNDIKPLVHCAPRIFLSEWLKPVP